MQDYKTAEYLNHLFDIESPPLNLWIIPGPGEDLYATYGGGGSGEKNGHFGCKHTPDQKTKWSNARKGRPGYHNIPHSEETKRKWSELRKGKIWSSKLTKTLIDEIRDIFNQKLPISEFPIGSIMKNGKPLTYERAFAKKYSSNYHVTETNIFNIITGKSWQN